MRNIFLAAFLLGLAHTIRGELKEVLSFSNGDAEIVYNADLVPSDSKEYNLCHLINCDEEEEIARNKSKKHKAKIGDGGDYLAAGEDDTDIDKDYDYNDEGQDLEMEEEIDDDDTDNNLNDDLEDDLDDNLDNDHFDHPDDVEESDDQLALDDNYLYEKPKLFDNNFVQELSSRDVTAA